MEISMTKMSKNGQVVIPANVRREARANSGQFLVYYSDEEIKLRRFNNEKLLDDLKLVSKIRKAEVEIKDGKFVRADSKMKDNEIDSLLMK